MRNIIPILRSLGFLESEVKTYLAALEMGPSTVLELNKKIGLSRQAIYTAIESLIKQGLMSSVEKGKKTLYAAESPERLRSFAEAKLKNMESTVREIKKVTADLKLLEKGEKPVVRLLEGLEGLKAMQADVIKTNPKQIDEIVNIDAIDRVVKENELEPLRQYLTKSNVKRRSLSISIESIPPKGPHHKPIHRKDVKFDGDVMVYDSKIALMTFRGNMISVLIDSPEIADTIRALFTLAWDSEKK